MACAPVAHAVLEAWQGPFKRCLILGSDGSGGGGGGGGGGEGGGEGGREGEGERGGHMRHDRPHRKVVKCGVGRVRVGVRVRVRVTVRVVRGNIPNVPRRHVAEDTRHEEG